MTLVEVMAVAQLGACLGGLAAREERTTIAEESLGELGYDAQRIAELRDAEVI